MKKRILCILLVLCMVMAVMPIASITAIAKTDDEVQLFSDSSELTQPIISESVKQSAEEFYNSYSAKNSDWVSTSCKLINTALTSLPVTGKYEKIGVWVGKQFLNLFMGTKETDNTEEILDAINQLNMESQTTLLKLDQLTEIVKDQNQLYYINEYYNGDKALYALTKIYMAALQNTDNQTDEQIEATRRQLLTYDIPGKSSSDINSLSSLSSYDQMVLAWGEKLKSNIFLNDGSCNAIELMNNYALGHFKWEHQGYEMRENYWSSLINLYVTSSDLMRQSLNARIEVYEEAKGESSASTLRSAIEYLNKLNKDIQYLGKTASVTRLNNDIRHYQVKGHEVYLFTQTTKQNLPPNDNTGRSSFITAKNQKTNEYWFPFYKYKDKKTGKVYEGLNSKYYKYIYDDYNPAGSSKIINLYDIFFSKAEGNLTPPKGINYSGTVTFVSNDMRTVHEVEKYFIGIVYSDYWDVQCKLFEGYGKISNEYYGLASIRDSHSQTHGYINEKYLNSFIMVIPAETPNNEVDEGQGEIVTEEIIPSTVTFDANGGSVDIKSIKTDMNGYIAELPTPSYTGYEFDGWYTAQNVKVTSNTQFAEDTTVYAKWISVNSSPDPANPTKSTSPQAGVTSPQAGVTSPQAGVNSPKTGDNGHIALWLALLFVSSGILIGANAYRKKKTID
ncbi:MAG: InlB B-repeat-containing protein [Acutalibacteraceae bacterium]